MPDGLILLKAVRKIQTAYRAKKGLNLQCRKKAFNCSKFGYALRILGSVVLERKAKQSYDKAT